MTATAAVDAAGLVKTFGQLRAVDGIDLHVRQGEIFGVLGPNGAGKTTALRMLATLLPIDAGQARVFGVDVTREPHRVRQLIGITGQYASVDEDLTATENLAFHAELHRVADAGPRVAELVEWTGLGAAARRPVRTFSRGMMQRLALARALVHRPELLLLDEPFSGLDPQATSMLETLLADLRAAGHAIVLSTHDVPRAAALATRVVMLHRGRIDWDGAAGRSAGVAIAARFDALVATARRA